MPTSRPNLTELIAQLPATDVELEAQKAAQQPPSDKPKPPPPDNPAIAASKFTGPDPVLAAKICDQILAGGRAALLELIGLVRPVADPGYQNYKAEYLVHCLTIHVGHPGKTTERKLLVEVLTDQISNPKLATPVRAFLIRELQLLAGRESLRPLGRLLTDDALCQPAAAALVAIGADAADQLISALPRAKGSCRLIIVQSLAALGTEEALRALRGALQDADVAVQSAAAWGLARLGDSGSVDALLKVATPPTCLLLAETLIAKNRTRDAAKIYRHIRTTRTGPKEQYLRDLAAKALASLGG